VKYTGPLPAYPRFDSGDAAELRQMSIAARTFAGADEPLI